MLSMIRMIHTKIFEQKMPATGLMTTKYHLSPQSNCDIMKIIKQQKF